MQGKVYFAFCEALNAEIDYLFVNMAYEKKKW